ncbi:MAG: DUF115 domain-containing protein [bacterium]|nr:DUF115 domain-containing protein [bacterium]
MNDSMIRLKNLKNKFKGKRVFIICNGPSLNKIDIKRLAGEYTFSFNRAYIAYDDWGFVPQFYSVIDKVVLPDNREDIGEMISAPDYKYMHFFFPGWAETVLKKNTENVYYLEDHSRLKFFEENLRRFVVLANVGATSLQIAFYLGFREIVLVGCDANYVEKPKEVEIDENETERVGWTAYTSTGDTDPNHFCPAYFGKGKKYSIPNAANHLRGWLEIKKWVDVYNTFNPHDYVSILNASPGTKLEYFEKIQFETLFNHPDRRRASLKEQINTGIHKTSKKTKKEKIILFGTERSARKFLEKFTAKYEVLYFVDNDKEKWNEKLYGKPIKNPAVLAEKKDATKIVVCITDGMKRLKNQLNKLGVFGRCVFFKDIAN